MLEVSRISYHDFICKQKTRKKIQFLKSQTFIRMGFRAVQFVHGRNSVRQTNQDGNAPFFSIHICGSAFLLYIFPFIFRCYREKKMNHFTFAAMVSASCLFILQYFFISCSLYVIFMILLDSFMFLLSHKIIRQLFIFNVLLLLGLSLCIYVERN